MPKWLPAPGRAIAAGAIAAAAAGLAASPAHAGTSWDPDIWTVAELQDGQSFYSTDGRYSFSDFHFSAVGFDESAFEEYLVQPRDTGFKLILGFGDLFGPGSLEMVYTATAVGSYLMDAASIPLVALYNGMGVDPLVEVEWDANGQAMSLSANGPPSFPFHGVSTAFDPVHSLVVEQVVTLSNGPGIVKVQNGFGRTTALVPEPGSGLLVGFGLGLAAVLTTHRHSRT